MEKGIKYFIASTLGRNRGEKKNALKNLKKKQTNKINKLKISLLEDNLGMRRTYPGIELPTQQVLEEVGTPVQDNDPYQVWLSRKYINLYRSAQSRGKEFSLEIKDVHNLVSTKTCYYTGVEFSSKNPNLVRTIDRLDPNKGYVKGNVVACTNASNQIKNRIFEMPMKEFGIGIDFYKKVIEELETLGG